MKLKEINRNIDFDTRKSSSSFRCKYNDRNDFDILRINISFKGELKESYEIESKNLPEGDSIHFKAEPAPDGFKIISWTNKSVKEHIKKV